MITLPERMPYSENEHNCKEVARRLNEWLNQRSIAVSVSEYETEQGSGPKGGRRPGRQVWQVRQVRR
ncbi:MAG: hypothetical protein AAF628_16260 [Planctomycetota bacterium]